MQEEARRTFAAPPEPQARRHSVDVPLKTIRDFSPPSSGALAEVSAMPAGVPLPSEQDRSVGVRAPRAGEARKSLPAPLLSSPSLPAPPPLAFKPLIERRTTGSSVLAASGAGLSIDSPAPPRVAERMPPMRSASTSSPSDGYMLPPTSFTPAPRANGANTAASLSDAESAPSAARRHSIASSSLASSASTLQPAVSTLPLASSLTYAPVVSSAPPPVAPAQSAPLLRSAHSTLPSAVSSEAPVLHYATGTARSDSPRLRLVPSPRSSPHASPPPAAAGDSHTRKRDKYVWRQKMRSVNAQITNAAATKRAAFDETAAERAVAVERALAARAPRSPTLRTSVSPAVTPDVSPVPSASPVVEAKRPAEASSIAQVSVSVPVTPSYSSMALLWVWFLASYFLFGLQLLSVAAKETCEALATGTSPAVHQMI